MTPTSEPPSIPLFLGSDFVDSNEPRLIARLREDLRRHGVTASLYANVTAGRRGQQRQVDLIVRTSSRVVVCEIKTFNPQLPVVGRLNGPWRQVLADGQELVHDSNAALQANQAAFAVSDSMRKLARNRQVSAPGNGGRFVRCFDTVVCMFERIPDGSDIERHDHVRVMDYAGLVDLIRTERTGECLSWTARDWEVWTRELGLYRQGSPTERAMDRAARIPEVGQARTRFATTLRAELTERVPTGLLGPDGEPANLAQLCGEADTGGDVVVRGRSGSGKSLLAGHLALELTNAGRFVVLARCGDFEGRLSSLLGRAVAPFSSADHEELMASAAEAGVGLTVVLDEFDRCPPNMADDLSSEVSALKLKAGCSVVLTTTGLVPASLSQCAAYELLAPSAEERSAILVVHRARNPERLRDLFDTPLELAIAAAAESELRADADQVDLFDAYLRKQVASEQQRARLRLLAMLLHERLSASLPAVEVTASLARDGASPEEIDWLLGCSVLTSESNRVRFSHELLQRFLAAEHIARELRTGEELGTFLTAPPNRVLREWAIGIADDAERWTAITRLSDVALTTDALAGRLGAETQRRARVRLDEALQAAAALTDLAQIQPPESPDPAFVHWDLPEDLGEFEASLVAAAGALLQQTGHCDPSMLSLIDATDRLCHRAARELVNLGSQFSLTATVGAAYVVMTSGTRLPAQLLFNSGSSALRQRTSEAAAGRVRQLLEGAGDSAWGRYLLAALVADPRDPADIAQLPTLIRSGWEQRAYHVRLQILWAATRFAGVPEPDRSLIGDAVDSLGTEGLGMGISSSLVETLSAFGRIEPIATVDDIGEQIAAVLARADEPDAAEIAAAMVSNQFEDDIIGPYWEAIHSLAPATLAGFLCLAAKATTPHMWVSWTMNQLADLAETGAAHRPAIRSAVARHVARPDPEAFMKSEAAATWEAAVRAWAWCAEGAPAAWDGQESVWTELGRTLLLVHRGQEVSDSNRSLVDFGADAVRALYDLRQAQMHGSRDRRSAFSLVQDLRREEMRHLLVWAVGHPDALDSHWARDLHHFAISGLGSVGAAEDAEILREWTVDSDLGEAAAQAMIAISRSGT
ncbi:MAG: NERD domain-containing protein [Microthrixaceae bacterium]